MSATEELERLIASAYRDLGPAAATESAVREALPAERAQPVRHRNVVMLAVVAALGIGILASLAHRADVRAGGDRVAGEGEDASLRFAVVARPPIGTVARGDDWIRVQLRADGRILVPGQPGKEWREVDARALGEHLQHEAASFHEREAAEGRSGYEQTAGGVRASRLRVDLFVDREAQWRDVGRILTICAERRMPHIAWVVRDPKGEELRLDASLPTDLGLAQTPEIRVSVRILAGDPVRYGIGNEEVEELASVARYIASAKKAVESSDAPLRGEIKVISAVTFAEVVKVLGEFRQAGYAQVLFFGTVVPERPKEEKSDDR
jgi:hypothetical protein